MPGYPPKPYHDNDDETVDTDADESTLPEAKAPESSVKHRARLTTISRAYDLDGDGELDEAEQAMRDRDVEGRGYLTNEEIYDVVQEQLRAQRSAGYMKKLVAALVCFVVVLALSNLGTSLAAAFLAKDLTAGDDAVMRVAATGNIAAAQSTADVYDAPEMTDDEMDERRRLVVREMDEDPHSHPHRRLARRKKGKNNGRGSAMVTHDSRVFEEVEFSNILDKCQRQENVYLTRNYETSKTNTCLCARGVSVVVKDLGGKKGKGGNKDKGKGKDKDKGKGNDKKKGNDKVIKIKTGGNGRNNNNRPDRDIIIDNGGRKFHVSCRGNNCYGGGDMMLRGLNEDCIDNECEDDLFCDFGRSLRTRGGGTRRGICQKITVDNIVTPFDGAGPGQGCDAGRGARGERTCAGEYYCRPRGFDARAFRAANGIGGPGAGGRSGMGGAQGQGVLIVGPSGVIDTRTQNGGNMGVGGGARGAGRLADYSGPGLCVRTVGWGQSCFNDADCGGGVCDGLGANLSNGGNDGMSGTIQGPSGSISYGMSNIGGMAVEGICS